MPVSVPARQKATAFRELATQIDAGVSLYEALARQLQRPINTAFHNFFQQAGQHVAKGNRLSVIMRQYPGMFSDITIALIQAGEEGGRLDDMLKQIAEYLEREVELRNTIRRETIYPKILVGAAIFIPLIARCMIAWLLNGFIPALIVFWKGLAVYTLIIGVPLIAGYLIYRSIASSETGKNSIDRFKLSVPGLGGIIKQLALAKFARAYGALWGAGLAPARAIPLAANACGNRHIAGTLKDRVRRVEQGTPLTETLRGTALEHTILMQLMETGEQTGNVDQMMTKAAEHYEGEAHTKIHQFAVAIVPVVVIIMGIIVGYMVISFYLKHYGAAMGLTQ